MAKKRERKPIEPEIIEPLDIFVGISGNPLEYNKPEVQSDVVSGTLEDAMTDLLGTDIKISSSDPPLGEESLDTSSQSDNTSIDDYIRRQVRTEIYGTDTPTSYDIISQAIKRRL